MAKVLVAGVYLLDQENCAAHIMFELGSAVRHHVTQRWAALRQEGTGSVDLPCTVRIVRAPAHKFAIISDLVGEMIEFDWLVICDDDVELPPGFVDDFVQLADRFDFALCQPARTPDSFFGHRFVCRVPGLLARRTRFVEIGPITCIRRDAFPIVMPFDGAPGMGWGLDLIWPVRIERAGMRMGIIDAVPVAHRLRRPAHNYSESVAYGEMQLLLSRNEHLTKAEAFTVIEAYAI